MSAMGVLLEEAHESAEARLRAEVAKLADARTSARAWCESQEHRIVSEDEAVDALQIHDHDSCEVRPHAHTRSAHAQRTLARTHARTRTRTHTRPHAHTDMRPRSTPPPCVAPAARRAVPPVRQGARRVPSLTLAPDCARWAAHAHTQALRRGEGTHKRANAVSASGQRRCMRRPTGDDSSDELHAYTLNPDLKTQRDHSAEPPTSRADGAGGGAGDGEGGGVGGGVDGGAGGGGGYTPGLQYKVASRVERARRSRYKAEAEAARQEAARVGQELREVRQALSIELSA
eukprot:5705643-Prymnesium_polylepis.2